VIIFDLRCAGDHRFEAWFKDVAAFEEQRKGRLITCPVCGGSDIERIPSSVSVISRSRPSPGQAEAPREVDPRMALKLLHDFLDRHFDDVGDKFAQVAMKIHKGEEEKRNIRGTTSKEEEKTLTEEGVQFIKVPMLKYDS
jgi:hypothetical protein